MKFFSILFTVSLLLQINVPGQMPDTLWTKTIGGVDEDNGFSIQQTMDGGYIICGSTYSSGNASIDLWLIKTDGQGEVLWNKIYGGGHLDQGYSVQQTTDGGYIICGRTYSFGYYGYNNLWLIKTDTNGDTLWTKTMLGYPGVTGQSVLQTDDNGYLITGLTHNGMGENNVWLVRTDVNGDIAFTRQYEGDCGMDVKQTTYGGYIITGSKDNDLLVIKTDSYGDTIWTKTYDGGDDDECGNSIILTNDGGYIIAGETNSDAWLIKIDYNGDTLWSKTYVVENKYECGNTVKLNSQGGYIICGTKFTMFPRNIFIGDVLLIYTDQFGDTICTKTYGGVESEEGYAINYTDDGGYIVVGSTESFGAGSSDIWLIKLSPDSVSYVSNEVDVETYYLYQSFPNPFNPSTKIKYSLPQTSNVVIKIFDILGNEIATLVSEEKPIGTYELTWYAEGLPSGVYFYRLQAGDFVETKKMVLIK